MLHWGGAGALALQPLLVSLGSASADRGEWQRYNDMKDAFDSKSNVDVFSVGVLYRFQ